MAAPAPSFESISRDISQGRLAPVYLLHGEEGYYIDALAHRFEKWVRQHFVNFLVEHRGYPAALMANETSIRLNGLSRRCDSVAYSRTLKPLAVGEYKTWGMTYLLKTRKLENYSAQNRQWAVRVAYFF